VAFYRHGKQRRSKSRKKETKEGAATEGAAFLLQSAEADNSETLIADSRIQ
jgi:hypothetical protein